jgi:hypothetical protein
MSVINNPRLTPEEAAEFLRLKVQTLALMRCKGRGPKFLKLGRAVRYERSELERFIDASRFSNTSEASVRGMP